MYVGPLFFAFTGPGISWSHVQEPRWGNATSQWVLWSMLLKYRCSDGSKSYVNYKMKIKENRAVTMHKARSHQQSMQQTSHFWPPTNQSQLGLLRLSSFFCESTFLFCILFLSAAAALQSINWVSQCSLTNLSSHIMMQRCNDTDFGPVSVSMDPIIFLPRISC
jgi:hypothetical protein